MPHHQMDASGRFVPLEEKPFSGTESLLEDWIESNPHLLLEGETVAIIGRQPRTTFGKFADLLGIDSTGATVIIELKRGVTPRAGARSDHTIWIRKKKQCKCYYAEKWVLCRLDNTTPDEAEQLRQLSEPSEVKPTGNDSVRFHLKTDDDLAILQKILIDRLTAMTGQIST
jgi:hypothetical protein